MQEEIDIENLVLQRIKLTLKPIFALFKVFNNPPLISIDVSIEKLHRMERKAAASPHRGWYRGLLKMPTMEKSGRASQNADIESEALKSDGFFFAKFSS